MKYEIVTRDFENKGTPTSKIVINYRNIKSVKNLQYLGSDLPFNLNDLQIFVA
jgi:hypothetical protein